MSDVVHRLRADDVETYCGRQVLFGERMRTPTKLGRCAQCEMVNKLERPRRAKRVRLG